MSAISEACDALAALALRDIPGNMEYEREELAEALERQILDSRVQLLGMSDAAMDAEEEANEIIEGIRKVGEV